MAHFGIDSILSIAHHDRMTWGTPAEKETHRRIKIAVWAYAYEIANDPIVSDAVFDVAAYQINLSLDTGMPHLDGWFRKHFKPFTGQWIHNHPQLDRIREIYERNYRHVKPKLH